jgi:hypothetical protein
MQVADDDASVARVLLASFREMLCAPSLVERYVCREQLVEGISQGGGCRGAASESHGRLTSPTTVTTSTASRSACF